MESVGALCSPTGASSNILSLPASCPWDEDEESLGLEGIKPKSSPIPRRRSSASSDDSLLPSSSSRRVSFADAFGLSLVSVKQFDTWGATDPSGSMESDLNEDKEYYMVPLFTLPQTSEELALRVHKQKLELESLELVSGTTTLRGIIRVLNICFDKMVCVRTSLDSWKSHFDLLAEYVPGSSNGGTDCFSFKLTLGPPFGEEGTRVDFCLRYETSLGTFWANNNENNYSLFCWEKIKEKSQNENENRRKSCLKTTSPEVSALTVAATNNEEFPVINLNSGSLNENKKLEKESKELVEEISRNHSHRSRRKAARLANVKEHFAKREEENKQGTKTKDSEVTAETSM
ncbi:protein phosphatase 1 regulatory subunit 3A-like [Cyprinus carpio]|uniref:Protein phosphatase 1 regulatory subunit 3A-like n=1 Tax=Cyprinus carpio TaxID=7962 RepID=A0A9Q9ZBK1_CYPCA|nr:protein phosphatase 1 regulatory subunit 3A-like [Cyprinus carpio]